jgi:transposase InsO family protein
LAEDFEPWAQTIRSWVNQSDLDRRVRSDGLTSSEREELRRLRREVEQLKVEREILKKAAARSTRCVGAPPGRAARSPTGIQASSPRSYGKPRMYAELREEGAPVNHKRMARLVKVNRLIGISRQEKWPTTKPDENARPAPDLVNRDTTADRPDELWVADIPSVPTSSGFLYLPVVVDARSRRVVGGSIRTHLKTDLVLKTNEHRLPLPLSSRTPDALWTIGATRSHA